MKFYYRGLFTVLLLVSLLGGLSTKLFGGLDLTSAFGRNKFTHLTRYTRAEIHYTSWERPSCRGTLKDLIYYMQIYDGITMVINQGPSFLSLIQVLDPLSTNKDLKRRDFYCAHMLIKLYDSELKKWISFIVSDTQLINQQTLKSKPLDIEILKQHFSSMKG